MMLRPPGRFLILPLVLVAPLLDSGSLLGEDPAPAPAALSDDAAKRLQWLKSRTANATPAPAATTPAPPPKRFAVTRSSELRPLHPPPEITPAPDKPTPRIVTSDPTTKKSTASIKPSETPAAAPKSKTASAGKTVASATATPTKDSTPAPSRIAKATPTPHRTTSPTPATASTKSSARDLLSIPMEIARLTTPRPGATTNFTTSATPSHVAGRYPWKTNIVTTVFWIGEAPSGNNLTPNHASSWDMNWARAYGGYDNPNPGARRNFIPIAFTPRQNPFYCALPYNDVTRGTTKPESRLVIPWFRSAFERPGKSVCRDRWVAIRSREGKVAYAQWSDCGPFRTDHWQYVFGKERPRPNLNNGAGLDVSPAVRDYLDLQSTDVTDWKFVDDKDVPYGPWSRYGDNNTFAQRGSRSR